MKSQPETGITLGEVLAVIVVGGIVASIGFSAINSGFGSTAKEKAEAALIEYSQAAGLNPINCVARDTDGDGYVSCSAKDPERGSIVALQCASSWGNEGCKVATPRIYGGN